MYITEPSSVLCVNFRILAGGVWRSVILQPPKTSLVSRFSLLLKPATYQSPVVYLFLQGFPGGSAGKESSCNVRDQGSIPGLGRSRGEGNGNALQYSGLENSMDRIVHGVAKSGK